MHGVTMSKNVTLLRQEVCVGLTVACQLQGRCQVSLEITEDIGAPDSKNEHTCTHKLTEGNFLSIITCM